MVYMELARLAVLHTKTRWWAWQNVEDTIVVILISCTSF